MQGLSTKDLRAVLGFVDDAWSAAGEHPFPVETMTALIRLIPCDAACYSVLDEVERRSVEYVSSDSSDDGGGEELFWEIVDEHPLCRYQATYDDYSATRLSDVISPRALAASRVYSEWFRPLDVAAELEAGISRSPVSKRTFLLDRSSGDFSDRDRLVLEMVRPHLARIHEMDQLRRAGGETCLGAPLPLTQRESQILELVAQGLTNAAIAQRLWISPGTVKKHLDNVYEKLDVSSRAAATARLIGCQARAI